MIQGKSQLFITGPEVIRATTHEEVSFEDLGGAQVHSEKSGVCDLVAANEPEAMQMIKNLLSFLPSSYQDLPERIPARDTREREAENLFGIIPENPKKFFNMKDVLRCLLDDGDFFEMKPRLCQEYPHGIRQNGGMAGRHRRQSALAFGRGVGCRCFRQSFPLHSIL